MKLGWTLVYVPDVAATVAFYEAAFGLARRFVHDSGGFAEMETGETALGFVAESMADAQGLAIRPNRPDTPPAAIELCLVTDDPDAAWARAVAAGAIPEKPVTAKPWGQRVGYVRDLNGVLVELCSPLGT